MLPVWRNNCVFAVSSEAVQCHSFFLDQAFSGESRRQGVQPCEFSLGSIALKTQSSRAASKRKSTPPIFRRWVKKSCKKKLTGFCGYRENIQVILSGSKWLDYFDFTLVIQVSQIFSLSFFKLRTDMCSLYSAALLHDYFWKLL